MKTQLALNPLPIRVAAVSAISVVILASFGLSVAASPSVALVEDPTVTGAVQDICVDTGLEVKLFVHAGGRVPAVVGERSPSCETDKKGREIKAAATVSTRLAPVEPISPDLLQEKS